VFLGGINNLSGNKPPWSVPAKIGYSAYDVERAKKYFGQEDIRTAEFFPILSILVSIMSYQYGEDGYFSFKFVECLPSIALVILTRCHFLM
jgi:2-hydroxychromene-2-carboxylate isomerase